MVDVIEWIVKLIVDGAKGIGENPLFAPWITWLIIGGVFLLVELLHASWILIWFSVGAVCAAIAAAIFPGMPAPQVASFFVGTTVSICFGRPVIKRLFFRNADLHKTNTEALMGRPGLCCEDIDSHSAKGAVKVFGTAWKARSAEGSPIKRGEVVEVIGIDGLCLIVKPLYPEERLSLEAADGEAGEEAAGEGSGGEETPDSPGVLEPL
ncbi:MAG: NfeD family protein [Chloroflexi bacterium]|nr:NfeD family protein [Chloroflexota bacterium]